MESNKVFGYGMITAGALLMLTGLTARKTLSTGYSHSPRNDAAGQITYSPEIYARLAQEIYQAMDRFITDKVTVFRIMESMKTSADLEKLIFVFGIRVKSSFLIFRYDYSLTQWLKDTLKGNDLERVRLVYTKHNIPF